MADDTEISLGQVEEWLHPHLPCLSVNFAQGTQTLPGHVVLGDNVESLFPPHGQPPSLLPSTQATVLTGQLPFTRQPRASYHGHPVSDPAPPVHIEKHPVLDQHHPKAGQQHQEAQRDPMVSVRHHPEAGQQHPEAQQDDKVSDQHHPVLGQHQPQQEAGQDDKVSDKDLQGSPEHEQVNQCVAVSQPWTPAAPHLPLRRHSSKGCASEPVTLGDGTAPLAQDDDKLNTQVATVSSQQIRGLQQEMPQSFQLPSSDRKGRKGLHVRVKAEASGLVFGDAMTSTDKQSVDFASLEVDAGHQGRPRRPRGRPKTGLSMKELQPQVEMCQQQIKLLEEERLQARLKNKVLQDLIECREECLQFLSLGRSPRYRGWVLMNGDVDLTKMTGQEVTAYWKKMVLRYMDLLVGPLGSDGPGPSEEEEIGKLFAEWFHVASVLFAMNPVAHFELEVTHVETGEVMETPIEAIKRMEGAQMGLDQVWQLLHVYDLYIRSEGSLAELPGTEAADHLLKNLRSNLTQTTWWAFLMHRFHARLLTPIQFAQVCVLSYPHVPDAFTGLRYLAEERRQGRIPMLVDDPSRMRNPTM